MPDVVHLEFRFVNNTAGTMGGAVAALTGASFYLLWLLSFVVIVVGAVVAAAVCSFVLFMFFLAGAQISLTNCYFMNNTVTSTSGQAGGKVTLEGQPLLPRPDYVIFGAMYCSFLIACSFRRETCYRAVPSRLCCTSENSRNKFLCQW